MRTKPLTSLVGSVGVTAATVWSLVTGQPFDRRINGRKRWRSRLRGKQLSGEDLESLVMLSGFSALGGSVPNPNDPVQTMTAPLILTTPGQTYQLQTSLRFTSGSGVYIAAPNVTLDLNGHTIYYGSDNVRYDRGVVIYYSWDQFEPVISIPGASNPDNPTIENGSIVDEGTGANSHGIYGVQANNATITNLRITVGGEDSATIAIDYGNQTIQNNVLIDSTNSSFDRMADPANVWCQTSLVLASNNVVIGGNSGFNVSTGSQITDNVISQSDFVTDGYGVTLFQADNVTIANNLILPPNGRGVLVQWSSGVTIQNNVILTLEVPNAEFGSNLNAGAIRFRYDNTGGLVTGNTSLGIGGGSSLVSASGLYLGDSGVGSNTFQNNNMSTILIGQTSIDQYVQPITLESQGYTQPATDAIDNNTFNSNDYLIRVGGWDGPADQVTPLVGNAFNLINGSTAYSNFMAAAQAKLTAIGLASSPAAAGVLSSTNTLISSLISGVGLAPQNNYPVGGDTDRATWFTKYFTGDDTVTLLDSQWGAGVDPTNYAYTLPSAGTVALRVGVTLQARLTGTGGTPLANTAVQLTTDQGDTYNLTTDANGYVGLPVLEFGIDKADPDGAPFSVDNRVTSTITVSGYPALALANATLLSLQAAGTVPTYSLAGATSVNHAPTGANHTITTPENTAYAFATSDFGFSDPNDTPPNSLLAVKITTLPTAGTLADNGVAVTAGQFVAASDIAAGLLKFTPTAGAYGTSYASFTFQVEDNGGTAGGGANLDPSPKTMTVNVTATATVNHAPTGASKSISMLEGASYAFATSDFGFSDPNDTPPNTLLAVKITTLPTAGTLADNGVAVTAGQFVAASDIAAGLLKFTPLVGTNGAPYTTFTFQVEDNGGTAGGGANLDPAPKTMTMNVTEVNHAPAGASKSISMLEGASYAFATSDFGFSDPNDTPANSLLAVKITTLPTAGTLADNGVAVTAGQFVAASDIAAGLLKFAPAAGAYGTSYATFTFQVEDNGGTAGGGANLDPSPKTMTMNVTEVSHAPTGTSKTINVLVSANYAFATSDFGFSDPNDTPANTMLAVKISTLPTKGTLTDNGAAVTAGQFVSAIDIAAGLLKFTPAVGTNGSPYTSFTFQVEDNGGTAGGGANLDPAPKTITINVTGTNNSSAPSVTTFSPAAGATSVATGASVTVTFSEALDATTVNASTVFLTSGNAAVAATLSYNAANDTVTLTPTMALANSTTYTITVVGGAAGVKDLSGNALAANATSSFTTVAAQATTFSLWPLSTMPTTAGSSDNKPIELGVQFTPSTSGFITGMRYYKSAANTGTHTGSLWSSTGQLLATATFTGEGASGWQQVMFSNPVAVTAGTTYVASYHTNTGHYAVNRSYFNSSYASGPLTVPAGGGVYTYGAGGFPTHSYQGSNYWVDVLFSTTPPIDNTPPAVTAFSPAGGATSAATGGSVTVTFSEALNAATVNASTVFLTSGSTAVAATLSYNAANDTVTLTPTSPLANSTTYTITVVGGTGGVTDLAGNALAANATSSFTTVAPLGPTASLWTLATTPAIVDSGDSQAIELGVKFTPTTSGFITGMRYYKSAANTGTHTGSLWSSNGQLLATATFTGEGASGWQQVMFSTPVAVTAGATYVAGYHTSTGHYAVNRSYFNSSYSSGSLVVPAGGGVYTYGAGGMPTKSYQGSNYWVDVLFSATTPPVGNNALPANTSNSTPPVVTAISPAGGATSVATGASVTVTFSEALDATTINSGTVFLTSGSAAVAATLSYNAANNTVTVTPTTTLANSATYALTVVGGANGVKDLSGNALAANATSSFTTVAAQAATSSLWTLATTPAIVDSGDGQAVELGVKFTPTTSGFITGVRYYKSAANTGTHTGSLWSSTGQLLATATFTGEGASGWQQVMFSTPVAVTAGTTYVAGYHTNTGHYAVNRSYFLSSYVSGPLDVPASGGVYLYGAGGFPTQTYQASNYWIDVLFSASA